MVTALCLCRLRVIPSPQGNKTFGRSNLLSAMRHQIFTPCFLLVALAAGCGAAGPTDAGPSTQPAQPPVVKQQPSCAAGSFRRVGSAKVAYAAVVRSRATVSHRPGGRAFARFGRLNVNRVPTVFSIRGLRVDGRCRPHWYLVQIAKRPNGITAWVPAAQVAVARVRARIVVDLSEKRVTLYRAGRRVLTATAA